MRRQQRTPADEGLEQIADLERKIILANEQNWSVNAVPEEERARFRPGVATLAANIAERLRAEYLSRRSGSNG